MLPLPRNERELLSPLAQSTPWTEEQQAIGPHGYSNVQNRPLPVQIKKCPEAGYLGSIHPSGGASVLPSVGPQVPGE